MRDSIPRFRISSHPAKGLERSKLGTIALSEVRCWGATAPHGLVELEGLDGFDGFDGFDGYKLQPMRALSMATSSSHTS